MADALIPLSFGNSKKPLRSSFKNQGLKLENDFVAPHWKRVASKRLAPGLYYYRNILTGESSWDLNEVLSMARATQTNIVPEDSPTLSDSTSNMPISQIEGSEISDQEGKKLARKLYVFVRDLIEAFSPSRKSNSISIQRDLNVFMTTKRIRTQHFSYANAFTLEDRTEAATGLLAYMERVIMYTELPYQCFYVGMAYIARLARSMVLSPNIRNMHKLMLICSLVAGKFLVDARFSNGFFAQVGGVKLQELNVLEYHLLCLLQWDLNLTDDELERIHTLIDEK